MLIPFPTTLKGLTPRQPHPKLALLFSLEIKCPPFVTAGSGLSTKILEIPTWIASSSVQPLLSRPRSHQMEGRHQRQKIQPRGDKLGICPSSVSSVTSDIRLTYIDPQWQCLGLAHTSGR